MDNKPNNIDTKTEPKHYAGMGALEPINIIEEYNLSFHLGNCIKYILRAGHKEGETELDDLKKARWYLDRYITEKEKVR